MTPKLLPTLVAAAALPAFGLLLKASLLAAMGLMAAMLGRKRSAALRHVMLAGALAALLVLPVASLVGPTVRIAVLRTPARPTILFNTAAPNSDAAWSRAVSAGRDAHEATRPSMAHSRWPDVRPRDVVGAVWALGAIVFLLPLLAGLYETRRLRRMGEPWPQGQALAAGLARTAAVPRGVPVLLQEAAPGPMMCGVVRPVILMPAEARRWPEADLRRALTHELEHARRGDWASLCAARVVCGLYWFHPLVWMLSRRLELEAERACDDAVLRQADALAYADQLVGFAERQLRTSRAPLLAMASRTDLTARIGAVLDRRQRRGRVAGRAVMLACVTTVSLVLALSPLRMVASAQTAAAEGGRQANPDFDAVVVREWKSGQRPKRYFSDARRQDPGRVLAQYSALSALVRYAFDLHASDPIENLPNWAGPPGADFGPGVVRYFVDARLPESATDEQARLMMQTLLRERFHLTWHRTSKPTKVLEMVVASGGLKLKPPNPAKDPKPPGGILSCPDDVNGCAFVFPHATTMADFAGSLSRMIFGRPVVDKTGLTGTLFVPLLVFIMPGSTSQSVPSAPTELRDVTGLALRPATDDMKVLVIDHVEKAQSDGDASPSGL